MQCAAFRTFICFNARTMDLQKKNEFKKKQKSTYVRIASILYCYLLCDIWCVIINRARLGLYVFCKVDHFKDVWELKPAFNLLTKRPTVLSLNMKVLQCLCSPLVAAPTL